MFELKQYWMTGLAAIAVTGAASAAPIFTTAMSGPNTPSTTTDEVTFAGDVSNSDLLHGINGTGGSWNANGATPGGLNDGLAGGDFDANGLAALNGKAWAKDGNSISFREFELGTGSNGLGFDITEIQSIASWNSAAFQNQKYSVSVRLVGGGSFTPLLSVEYQPFVNTGTATEEGGSTKVNVTDDTGVLISGIEAIRFDVLDTVSNNAGGTVFSEIDVFGASTVPEPGSLALLGLGGLLIARRRRA